MKVLQALQALEVFGGGTPAAQRRARALVDMAEAAVAGSTTGVCVPEIVAHIRHEDVSAGTSVMIEDEVAVSRTTAQGLCCDAAIVPLLEDLHGEPPCREPADWSPQQDYPTGDPSRAQRL